MKILVQRQVKTDKSLSGSMYIAGAFECFTLERTDGEGKGHIPAGEYSLIIDVSKRFGRRMPHILDVSGFEGVRIHSGNTAADTEGCILIGQTNDKDFVGQSKIAFENFFRKIDGQDYITIEIKDICKV